jgi:DNA-binding transcriptional LysR family regulator
MDRVSTMLSFVKVVDTGGFSSAARQLNRSTSVVTTHVKSLEDRLGVRPHATMQNGARVD